jgi:hypothetical protein
VAHQIDETMAIMKSHVNNMNNAVEQASLALGEGNDFKSQAVSVTCSAAVATHMCRFIDVIAAIHIGSITDMYRLLLSRHFGRIARVQHYEGLQSTMLPQRWAFWLLFVSRILTNALSLPQIVFLMIASGNVSMVYKWLFGELHCCSK